MLAFRGVNADVEARLRALPAAHTLIESEPGRVLAHRLPADAVRSAARDVIDELRREVLARTAPDDRASLTQLALERMEARGEALRASRLRRVINATGVVLHTNLGRAPLGVEVLDHVREAASGYCTLEYDLDVGARDHRDRLVAERLTALTGADDGLVVNNNAASLLLAATALGAGREVIVSRGELVEIGGGFRVPEILASCGAKLVEVGTTNRTRIEDYRRAITAATAMLLKVHRSNFAQVGFSKDVSLTELVALGRGHDVRVVEDLGSGALVDLGKHGLPAEPWVASSVAAGADAVLFSGDKLMGGPQAGLVVGNRDTVGALRRHPLARALRPGRLVVAALEATLRVYCEGRAFEQVPTLVMLTAPEHVVRARAERLAELFAGACSGAASLRVDVVPTVGRVGGGAMPTGQLASWGLRLVLERSGAAAAFASALRRVADPPVVVLVRDGTVICDLRTVTDLELPLLAHGLARSLETLHKADSVADSGRTPAPAGPRDDEDDDGF